jgi:hypothetical protein
VATPINFDRWTHYTDWGPRYVADMVLDLRAAHIGNYLRVLDGSLVIAARPVPAHRGYIERILRVFLSSLPADRRYLPDTLVRLPSGDGAVPDLVITSASDLAEHPRGLPAALVHTIVEAESATETTHREVHVELYAEAGIPCYWRIQPGPTIVVRLRDKARGWHEIVAPPGTETALPVVVDAKGTVVRVTLDPATLAA